MKRVLWGTALLFLLSLPAYGEERYSLSGNATFDEADRIFISLYTYEAFQNFRRKPLPPEPFTLSIEPNSLEKKAGKVPFRFESIPQGSYALLAFRDQDRPGTLRQPGRPASAYRMMAFSGRWEDVKVELNRNITGLEIRFEGNRGSNP